MTCRINKKNGTLNNICDIFDLGNIIKEPTCITSNNKASLLDVILTHDISLVGHILNFSCGLRDVHNLIACQLKSEIPLSKPRWSTYRSFKKFDVDIFNVDLENSLSQLKFSEHINVNEMYEAFKNTLLDVTNKHAPLKKKKCQSKEVPYMNNVLKQAIYKKRMLLHRYQKCRTSKNWEKFRLQRNYVTKVKRKSINQYFIERCLGGCKTKDFWPTVKPFLTNKGTIVNKDTILYENEKLVNDQQEVCDIFNNLLM